jgi:hypothetical protein
MYGTVPDACGLCSIGAFPAATERLQESECILLRLSIGLGGKGSARLNLNIYARRNRSRIWDLTE